MIITFDIEIGCWQQSIISDPKTKVEIEYNERVERKILSLRIQKFKLKYKIKFISEQTK